MKKMFNYVSFFSGLGGFDTGLNQIGGKCVLAAEWHELTRKSYHVVHGLMPKGDIRDLTWWDIPKSKVWTFGFPCQDLSVASLDGKERKKLEGERSGLFFQVMRLAKKIIENAPQNLPDFLWAENVEDLGPLLPVLRSEFHKIGYDMQFRLYNTKYWGLPQSRPRYHVLGVRKDLYFDLFDYRMPEENQDLSKVPKLKDFLDDEVDERYYYPEDYCDVTWHDIKVEQGKLNQIATMHTNWLQIMKRVYSIEGVAPTLHTCQGGQRQAKIVDGSGRIRRMTAREYLRLQGFPEEYYHMLKANKISNSQMYLMAGNAVSVNLIVAIGTSLLPYLTDGGVE